MSNNSGDDSGTGGTGGPGGYSRWEPHTLSAAESARLKREELQADQDAMYAANRIEREKFLDRIRPEIEAKNAKILSNLPPLERTQREIDARYASALGK